MQRKFFGEEQALNRELFDASDALTHETIFAALRERPLRPDLQLRERGEYGLGTVWDERTKQTANAPSAKPTHTIITTTTAIIIVELTQGMRVCTRRRSLETRLKGFTRQSSAAQT